MVFVLRRSPRLSNIYIKVFNVIIVDENLPTHFKNKTTLKKTKCMLSVISFMKIYPL